MALSRSPVNPLLGFFMVNTPFHRWRPPDSRHVAAFGKTPPNGAAQRSPGYIAHHAPNQIESLRPLGFHVEILGYEENVGFKTSSFITYLGEEKAQVPPAEGSRCQMGDRHHIVTLGTTRLHSAQPNLYKCGSV
jgi:hypothetical protein